MSAGCSRPSRSSTTSAPVMTTTMIMMIVVVVVIAICCLQSSRSQTLHDQLPTVAFEKWAELFGQTIYAVSAEATALTDLQTYYLLMQPRVRPVDGNKLVNDIKVKMEKMIQKRVEAVRRLVDMAETSYASYNSSQPLPGSYPNAKKLNVSEFELVPDPHFNGIPVNVMHSTVHVPTNVYDNSTEVLRGVTWSEALDEVFADNYRRDPTLSWQYFGSASGFFRNYPGIQWPKPSNDIDLYDCRTQGWYIQAAASPKDIVILVDTSGSMKGLRIEIAKATVEKIVDTLSDDDFFNVVKFSEEPEYFEPCFNGTLVQATNNNKEKVKAVMRQRIGTQNIAKFDKALTLAFDLLISMNVTKGGAQCNRAIMIITDGAPDTYVEIFAKKNWPNKDVRVFTYMIGREIGDPFQVKWMACSNKGYYSHISTLADVHEHVQEYIHVSSRPLVISRAQHSVWTNMYLDDSRYQQGVHFTTSVAQPVYDITNSTRNAGILLGVIGTDVPLTDFIDIIPQHKLGVNGYAFTIDNNGYVLFHPDLRPLTDSDKKTKPNYNSVDLSEVELEDVSPSSATDESFSNLNLSLRKNMLKRQTGNLSMKVKMHYDNMKRVVVRNSNYFYAPIDDTPFSFGIALPDGYGMHFVDGAKSIHSLDETGLSALRYGDIQIAPWKYCRVTHSLSAVDQLIKNLELARENETFYNEYCDDELVSSLLFDAEATRYVVSDWRKGNIDAMLNRSSKKNGVELVFVGTKSGLTRYLMLMDNLSDPEFIEKNKLTIKSPYYYRAADAGDGIFTFSVPMSGGQRFDFNTTVVTASTPIVVSINHQDSVAAVVGLRMQYSRFYELFMEETKRCDDDKDTACNYTCRSDEINCYLVDENGFIVLSKDPEEHVGRFIGDVEGDVMKQLLVDDYEQAQPTSSLFHRVLIYDYQALCDIWSEKSQAASTIYNPLQSLQSLVGWIMHKVVWFFIQINILGFWPQDWITVLGQYNSLPVDKPSEVVVNYNDHNGDNDYDDAATSLGYGATEVPAEVFTSGATDSEDDYAEVERLLLHCLENFVSREKFRELLNEFRLKLGNEPKSRIQAWVLRQCDHRGLRVVGSRPCTRRHGLYRADVHVTPYEGKTSPCHACSKSFSIHRVPRTNLMLMVVDARNCAYCQRGEVPTRVSLQPVEVDHNETSMCERLQTEIYRERPLHCYSYHPQEDASRCGGCAKLHNRFVVVITSLLVTTVELIYYVRAHCA